MKVRIALAFFIFSLGASAKEQTYSLDECYRLALERSDSVALSVEQINQAEAALSKAKAGFLPTVSGNGSFAVQEAPSSALGQNLFPSNQSTASISLKQNLFNGLKDLAVLRAKKQEKIYYQEARAQGLLQLFKDTAQAFYNVLAYEQDLKNYRDQVKSSDERRLELAKSRKYGRAREADVVTVESSIATLEASISNTQALLISSQEILMFLTGLAPGTALSSNSSIQTKDPGLEYWLEKVEDRFDLKQAKSAVEVARNNAKAARSGYLPSLDLAANYYPYRTGVYSDVHWDTTLSLTIPIFSGGVTKAEVSETVSQENSKEISLHLAKEQAIQAIRTAYRTWVIDLEQIERLTKAKTLALKSYGLMHQDNLRGIATNTDVLTALTASQETSRSADRQKYKVMYDYSLLNAESARLDLLEKP